MNSDFYLLSEKITQLAELTYALRRENAELRLRLATLQGENEELLGRINTAHQRLTKLLAKMPAPAVACESV